MPVSLLPPNVQEKILHACPVVEESPFLKPRLFDQIVRPLYQSLPIHPSLDGKEIVVTGSVVDDGLGDYYHILDTTLALRKDFPELPLRMIPIYWRPSQEKELLPRLPSSEVCASELRFEDHIFGTSYEHIKNSFFAFEISQGSEKLTPLRNIIKQQYKFFGEYSLGLEDPSMGLRPTEEGIFIKKFPSNLSLHTLQDEKIKEILFQTKSPSKEHIDNYFNSHQLFFSYLKHPCAQLSYIYSVIQSQFDPNEVIDETPFVIEGVHRYHHPF